MNILLKVVILVCGLLYSQRMPFVLFNQIVSGLILLGLGDPKGIPLYLTSNEPSSLRPLL